jgi:hypothetical protein
MGIGAGHRAGLMAVRAGRSPCLEDAGACGGRGRKDSAPRTPMRRVIPRICSCSRKKDSHRVMWAVPHLAVCSAQGQSIVCNSEFQRLHLFLQNYAGSASFSRAIKWLRMIALNKRAPDR